MPNADFQIPAQSVKGEYDLTDIRLVEGATVISYAAHRTAVITVTDVLVTQVTSRPLTYQEMVDKGIVVSPGDFSAYGNRTQELFPDGRIFKRAYDALNRLAELDELANPSDATGRLIRKYDFAGVSRINSETAGDNVKTAYGYDAARRLTSLSSVNSLSSAQIVQYAYGYTDDDLPKFEQRGHEGSLGDTFTFDADKRLTLATLSQASPTGPPDASASNRDQLYLGSVHERTGEQLTLAGATSTSQVSLNPRYGYTAYGSDTSRTYDREGELTGNANGTYLFDAKHRLVEADLTSGTKLEYGYDALNRRVEKRKTVSGNALTTSFFFDGWNAVEESQGGSVTRDTVFGNGLDDALEYRLFGTASHDYDIFRDGNGSTAGVISDTGAVQLFKYLDFGKASVLSGTSGAYSFDLSGTTTTSLWQGLTFDADLGWYYARNRWYDPTTGAFVTVDPLGYPDSPNPYVWGTGNAWARDPMGQQDARPGSFGRLFDAIDQQAAQDDESSVLADTLSGMWATVKHPLEAVARARNRIAGWFERKGETAGRDLAPAARYDVDAENREALADVGATGQAAKQRAARIQNELFRPMAVTGGRILGRTTYDMTEGLAVGTILHTGSNIWNEFRKFHRGELLEADELTDAYSGFKDLLTEHGIDLQGVRITAGRSDRVAVIGRSMASRVEPVANALGAETLPISPEAEREWKALVRKYGTIPDSVIRGSRLYNENRSWIQKLKREGYTILDLGGDPSIFYDMERTELYGHP